MPRRMRIPVVFLCACLFSVALPALLATPAVAAEGAAGTKAAQGTGAGEATGKATAGAHTARIEQETRRNGLTMRAGYDCWFAADGRFRLQGQIEFGQGQKRLDIVIVSDGKTVRELVESRITKQLFTYDVARVKEIIPEYDFGGRFSPDYYMRLARDLDRRTQPEPDLLDGHDMLVYTVAAGSSSVLPPPPAALPLKPPKIDEMQLWVFRDTRMPRRIIGYGRDEKDAKIALMTIEYKDVKTGVTIAPEKFRLEAPDDVIKINGTKIIESWFQDAARKSGAAK